MDARYRYNDIELAYTVEGEGDTVILLHGWGCDHNIWRPTRELLAKHFRLIAVDFAGFGESAEPTEVWGVEEYTRMVEQFAKDNGIERPALMGHSFGGRVSIVYASRNAVSLVVLVDAAGIKPKRPFKYYWKVYTFKTMKWLCNTFLPKAKAQAIIDKRRKGAGSSDYNNASPKMRAILSKVVNEDLKHLMPSIKAPTLLFWGNLDTATPLSDAKTMERLIPDAGLVVAHGTGHFSFLENQGLFTAVIKNFFKIK